MTLDKQIKTMIEDFKRDANIEETLDNMSAFSDLKEKIYMAIPEPEDHTGECYCNCSFCEQCEYM